MLQKVREKDKSMNLKKLTIRLLLANKEEYLKYVKGIAWHISAGKMDLSELPIFYCFGFSNDLTSSKHLPPLTCPHCGRKTFKPYYYLSSPGSGRHKFDGICTKCLHTEDNMTDSEYHKKFIDWLPAYDEEEND